MKSKKKYELGGIVGAEVEGGEVIANQGGSMEVKGPSHAQGGVDMMLPEGTLVFSDEVKGPDGKTMAERQKRRERLVKQQMKEMESSPLDQINKFSLERVFKAANQEMMDDLTVQALESLKNEDGEYEYGTPPWGIISETIAGLYPSIEQAAQLDALMGVQRPTQPQAGQPNLLGQSMAQAAQSILPVGEGIAQGAQAGASALGKGMANVGGATASKAAAGLAGKGLGAALGPAGIALGIGGPLLSTIINRAGDTDNPNYFEDYGREGLQENARAMSLAGRSRELQEMSNASQANAARRSNRASAGGASTMMALNAATGARQQQGNAQAANQYYSNLSNLFSERGRMQNEQDRVVMQGEAQADIANRQDRDQFFTNLSSNLSNAASGLMFAQRMQNLMPTNNVDIVSLLGLDYING